MRSIVKFYSVVLSFFLFWNLSKVKSQNFSRSELPCSLNTPWEIVHGPDQFLWLSEYGGVVSRVDPSTGAKQIVFAAPDYFAGDASEQCANCFNPKIGSGTLGLALHPKFASTPFLYLVYSYNAGTIAHPKTQFKIQRLRWDPATHAITESSPLITDLPTGYDHLGGRLIAVQQEKNFYLYFSVGDNGVSEINEPTCYTSQSDNPNNKAQNPDFLNGKILRYNIDGTIPSDNPIAGSPVFTRGHRNPQGLVYNSQQNLLYDIEHGDRTDDEINLLESGKNYGWKNIRGFHNDDNYPGEDSAIKAFSPDPRITGDALRAPIFTWCSTPQPTIAAFLEWCTVAPSDGFFYQSKYIDGWKNSLLVVTLKDGSSSDMELYRIKLAEDGRSVLPNSSILENPKKYFSQDQALNGRLRDVTVSPDGSKIFLINNGGAKRDKITIYTCTDIPEPIKFEIYPNPIGKVLQIYCQDSLISVKIYNTVGNLVLQLSHPHASIDVSDLKGGIYYLYAESITGERLRKKIIK